jgi:hypothetical protein
MSEHEYNKIREIVHTLHEVEKENYNKKFQKLWRGILIGLVPIIISAGIGGFMGVQTRSVVNEAKIRNNKELIEKNTENCVIRIDENSDRIYSLEKSDQQQWNYIGEYFEETLKTRGDTIK